MKNFLIKLRNGVIGFFYRHIFKRIFFKIDEERIHEDMVVLGKVFGDNLALRKITSFFFNFSDPALKQNIAGIDFKNPVGLSAGFDKNAEMVKIMPSLGFGFTEVGSITGEPCLGNPRPWLWRLPKSKSLVVNYGLKNNGCRAIAQKLAQIRSSIPLGISIAKTNSPKTINTENGISDYLKAIGAFSGIGNYFTLNISCPNAYGGQPFTDPSLLNRLLKEVNSLNRSKPIFLKMSPDLPLETIDQLIEVASKYGVTGFICSNLTKKRNNEIIDKNEIRRVPDGIGGLSGKALESIANNLIAYVFKKTGGEKVIIGCGGIFCAADAYKKIKLGASLVQLITGMIFEGPQVISEINLGLCRLLKQDGFTNISQAVGKGII